MPRPDAAARPPEPRRARRRAAAGWTVVALLAVLGLVAVGLGVAERTVRLPDDEVGATATRGGGDVDAQLLVTAPGVLETRPGPVTVTATSPDGGPVVLVLGRETDVVAWTDGVPTAVVGGLESQASLAVEPPSAEAAAGAPAVPDPATSDLWVAVAEGEGSATLEVEPPDGRWLVLAASDGTAPAPERLVLTWPQEVSTPAAVPLLVGGGTALLGALVLALVLARASRRRRAAVRAGDAPDASDGVPHASDGAPHDDRGGAAESPWAPTGGTDEETR